MYQALNSALGRLTAHDGFRRYFANTAWMFSEQILRMIAGVLVGIWVARYLGPWQFGLFSYAVAFVSIFGTIAKLGLDGIVVRDLVHDPALRDDILGTAFWLKLAGGILAVGAVGVASWVSGNDRTTALYVFIVAAGMVLQAWEVIDFYFQSKVLSKFVSICKITQLVLSSILKLYFVLTGAPLFWFVLVTLIDQLTLAVTLAIAYRWQKVGGFYRRFDRAIAKRLLRDGWPLIFSGLVIAIYMRIDQVMIKQMLGEKEVGLFSAAVRLTEVWYFIPLIITNSLFPAIVNARKAGEAVYTLRVKRLYSFMAWMAVAIALPMTFLSDRLVTLLYGPAYLAAGRVLMVYIWAGVFVFLGVASSKWFLSENLQRLAIVNSVVGAVVNIALNFILIPRHGIFGAAVATVVSQAVASWLMNLAFPATRDNFLRMSTALFTLPRIID